MAREVAPPTKLWVGTYEFALQFVPPDDPVLLLRGRRCDGLTDTELQVIYVSCALEDRKTMEIAWHEVTHAIDWVNDIDDGAREETIARKHGVAWSQFHLDNPRFVRWYSYLANKIKRERVAHPTA